MITPQAATAVKIIMRLAATSTGLIDIERPAITRKMIRTRTQVWMDT